MKKLIALLLAACMILSLCACTGNDDPGQSEPQNENPGVEQNQNQEQNQDSDPVTPDDPEDPAGSEDPQGQEQGAQDLTPFELAQSCIDLSVDELYALIGEPESSDYAPSCLNPDEGQDGNLYYDGFIVYTYREGEVETVSYVEEIE